MPQPEPVAELEPVPETMLSEYTPGDYEDFCDLLFQEVSEFATASSLSKVGSKLREFIDAETTLRIKVRMYLMADTKELLVIAYHLASVQDVCRDSISLDNPKFATLLSSGDVSWMG